jgi:hypothetical protein
VLSADHVKLDPQDLTAAGDWTVVGHTLYTATPASGDYFIYDGVWKLKDVALSFSVIPHLVQVENNSGLTVTKVTGSEETYYVLETPDYLYDYDGDPPHSSMVGVQIPLPKVCRYSTDVLIPPGLLSLWDLGDPVDISTARKIDDVIFYGRGDNYSVTAKNVTLAENNGRYVLVCGAEGLAYAVGRLRDLVVGIH